MAYYRFGASEYYEDDDKISDVYSGLRNEFYTNKQKIICTKNPDLCQRINDLQKDLNNPEGVYVDRTLVKKLRSDIETFLATSHGGKSRRKKTLRRKTMHRGRVYRKTKSRR
jgi:hypothetical protein